MNQETENAVVTAKPQHIDLSGGEDNQQSGGGALAVIESSRAMQEVKAQIMLAKQFPRDELAAYQKILNACKRPALAETALYSYSRGGTNITGPSIRLAETLKRHWGNLKSGWRELERKGVVSTVQAYAWDMETNAFAERVFDVKHIRNTKKGSYPITEERDIYENMANAAARRHRACILELIDGDVVEDATKQCEETIKLGSTPANIDGTVKFFAAIGVNKAMLEKRLQRNVEAMAPAQYVDLRKIYQSINDGMSKVSDWFDLELADKKEEAPETDTKAGNKLDAFKQANGAATPETKTPPVLHKPDVTEPYKGSGGPNTPASAIKPPIPPAGQARAKCATCGGKGSIPYKETDPETGEILSEGTEPCPACQPPLQR